MKLSKNVKPMEGLTFSNWTVLSFSHFAQNKGYSAYWNCRCSCGNEKTLCGSMLRQGRSSRCFVCSNKDNGRLGLDAMAKKHLYVARCEQYYKIGSSDQPENRIKIMRSSCPFPIILESVFLNRGNEEPHWHEVHKDRHHQGEWFSGYCEII